MGDSVIYIVVGLFFIGLPLYLIANLLNPKAKGQWDEKARLRGRMRAKHWKVSETVENLTRFLRLDGEPTRWLVSANLPGLMGVEGKHGERAWRSAITIRPESGPHLLLTMDMGLRADATEGAIPWTVLRRDGDFWMVESTSGVAEMSADGVSAAELPAVLSPRVRYEITSWDHAVAFHLEGSQVTVELDAELSGGDMSEVIEDVTSRLSAVIEALPEAAWA